MNAIMPQPFSGMLKTRCINIERQGEGSRTLHLHYFHASTPLSVTSLKVFQQAVRAGR